MSTVMMHAFVSPRLGCLSPLKPRPPLLRPLRKPLTSPKRTIVVAAWTDPSDEGGQSVMEKLTAPVAALVVCALLTGAVLPDEAMAARSGGRMGGSAFRSRAPSMPRGGGGYRQYNYYGSPGVAPPLVGGYGYGMGGYGLMPSFFLPIGFGGIFNIFIALFVINTVLNVFRDYQRRNDDQDDFDDM